MYYGGDYNPEQWPPSVWDEDVKLMREAGVNLVTVGVFAWSRLEPAEGRYTFGWLDDVLDRLHRAGIRVALATPTASPPPWFSRAYPDALPVTREGVRLSHGSRDTYCLSAPAYRAAARRIAGELADRYAHHPALELWHVHNEYGTWCYCDHVADAFRGWLRRRYPDLDALNDAWTTAFWSQGYGEWADVLPPRATQYLPNPAQVLDFRRFLSDESLTCLREQRDILRAANPAVPVTTNFALGSWVPVDQWAWAAELDLVAIDSYPTEDADAAAQTALHADLARSWGSAHGKPWLVMEQAPGMTYEHGAMVARPPGALARLALSHVARGSRGALYFQWRAPRGGAEVFHSAMVPHAGPDSRVFREVVALGEVLRRLSEVDGAGWRADAAVLWDPACWWALGSAGLPSAELDYFSAVLAVHGALWRSGATVDFARPGAGLGRYGLVCVPGLFLVDEDAARALESFVDGGGTAIVWYASGIADPSLRVWPDGYPGPLRDLLGIRVEEFHPLRGGATVPLSTGDTARRWTEHVRLAGAEPVVDYAGGPLAGRPAVTRHRYGAGTAWYVSTDLDWLDAFVGGFVEARPGGGVELVDRDGWRFALNHTDRPATVPAWGTDVVTGRAVDGELTVPPGGYAVIRSPR